MRRGSKPAETQQDTKARGPAVRPVSTSSTSRWLCSRVRLTSFATALHCSSCDVACPGVSTMYWAISRVRAGKPLPSAPQCPCANVPGRRRTAVLRNPEDFVLRLRGALGHIKFTTEKSKKIGCEWCSLSTFYTKDILSEFFVQRVSGRCKILCICLQKLYRSRAKNNASFVKIHFCVHLFLLSQDSLNKGMTRDCIFVVVFRRKLYRCTH